MKKITITEKFDRSKLIEGRNFGFGFAILKPTNSTKTTFDTMNAFTACKDYLNDFSYTEEYNKDIPEIYGFKHKYTGEFKNKRYFYLGVKSVHYKNGEKWKKFDSTQKLLLENNINLVKAINIMEDYLNLSKSKVTLHGVTDTEIVLKCPKYWLTRGYLISLLTLYIRCFTNVKKIENSFADLIKEHKEKFIIPGDKYLYANFEKLLKIKNPQETFTMIYPAMNSTINTIHNGGIHYFLNSLKDLK